MVSFGTAEFYVKKEKYDEKEDFEHIFSDGNGGDAVAEYGIYFICESLECLPENPFGIFTANVYKRTHYYCTYAL
jgi:hypothetical protein